MHHFATPLRPAQQTKTSQYKRKRVDDSADQLDGVDHDANDALQSGPPSPPQFDPWEREQRYVAGLSSNDVFQTSGPPFPHAVPRESRAKFTAFHVRQELVELSPPILASDVGSGGQPVGLRIKHLHVLSTVMHRCLLEGDYHRAAKAWGMILRTKAHGKAIEPRQNNLWGLGAELLLRRKDSQDGQSDGEDVYSELGFQRARNYYERLILQYPFRTIEPDAISATTFYPPLFSVWIMQVLERSRRSRRQHNQSDRLSDAMDDDTGLTSEERLEVEADIQREELAGAREICQRLDDLVQSPPGDKNIQLLELRGHVGLWISDLLLGKTVTQEHDDMDYDMETSHLESAADSAEKTKESLSEKGQAQGFFERASRVRAQAS